MTINKHLTLEELGVWSASSTLYKIENSERKPAKITTIKKRIVDSLENKELIKKYAKSYLEGVNNDPGELANEIIAHMLNSGLLVTAYDSEPLKVVNLKTLENKDVKNMLVRYQYERIIEVKETLKWANGLIFRKAKTYE